MEHGEVIKLDDMKITVYECNKKADCKRSRHCGKQCKFTADKRYAVLQKQLSILEGVSV